MGAPSFEYFSLPTCGSSAGRAQGCTTACGTPASGSSPPSSRQRALPWSWPGSRPSGASCRRARR
eukprot:7072541-Alexandrium_andersonii.AAC.1